MKLINTKLKEVSSSCVVEDKVHLLAVHGVLFTVLFPFYPLLKLVQKLKKKK